MGRLFRVAWLFFFETPPGTLCLVSNTAVLWVSDTIRRATDAAVLWVSDTIRRATDAAVLWVSHRRVVGV
ncbi:MAG: hypothetical protein LBJ41_09690 [Treponema sp.]|nr:hypothetical protein [Treponema sp.]